MIAGNGTLTEALEMGATEIVVTWVDRVHDDGEVREMTDADEAELAVLDNRSAELAEWDPDQLGETVTAFPEIEWDAGGWEPTDFADMGIEWPEPEVDEDTTTVHEHERDLPGDDGEDAREPITSPGDVWVLGDHRLSAGDLELHFCDEIVDAWERSSGRQAQHFDSSGTNIERPARTRPAGKPRTKARDGDKRQARRRVQTLILNGTLPAPADVPCVDCQAVPGREYDHHLGYGADHHEDVEALCAGCHHAREAERAKAKAPE